MKILVDARLLHGGGIGRFIREVGRRWLADSRVEGVRFLGRPAELEPWLAEVDGRGAGEVAVHDHPPYSLGAQVAWALRAEALRGDADVAFFPHYDAPLLRHPRPSVVVVHDLTQYLLPECFPWAKRAVGRKLLDGVLERADRVVTVSERSRADLVAWSPATAERIRVVPDGVSRVFRPLDDREREAALERWGPLRPYLLLVGARKPHKNLAHGARVLARLRRERPELRLVAAGPPGDGNDDLSRAAAELGLAQAVVEPGTLGDGELRRVYGLAEALLFPSLYEGFGLPCLEAMACGTPVVASARGAVPEVAGDAATLLEPDDVEGWARAVREILDAPPTGPERQRLMRHARQFPWDDTAASLLDVLTELTSTPETPASPS